MARSIITSSEEETRAYGKALASSIRPGDILCIEGDLGAGKTTFSKGLISALTGTDENSIQSPTFIYFNMYEGYDLTVCHFDLYRLEDFEKFKQLGFMDYLDSPYVCIIEWPCKITPLLPSTCLHLNISYINQTERLLALSNK